MNRREQFDSTPEIQKSPTDLKEAFLLRLEAAGLRVKTICLGSAPWELESAEFRQKIGFEGGYRRIMEDSRLSSDNRFGTDIDYAENQRGRGGSIDVLNVLDGDLHECLSYLVSSQKCRVVGFVFDVNTVFGESIDGVLMTDAQKEKIILGIGEKEGLHVKQIGPGVIILYGSGDKSTIEKASS